MYFSYVMGVDESIDRLSNEGFQIQRDGSNYMVSFPVDMAKRWEEFISGRLEEGYWNEYLAEDRVIFLFHLPGGMKRYEVVGFGDTFSVVDDSPTGIITLELFNANRCAIELKAGRRVGQLVFAEMDQDAMKPYRGKYQGQRGATGSRVCMDKDKK